MSKDLVVTNEIRDIAVKADELIDKSNVFMQISTRGADPSANAVVDFKIFDNDKLAKLAENMPEINRATNVFGRQNSQATGKLMSLHMISQSPYRRLKQCLAKIERKRQALKENIFKMRKEKIEMDQMLRKRSDLEEQLNGLQPVDGDTQYDLDMVSIELEEKAANIADSNIYIEGALKEIGMYQDAYKEIKESYDIDENWDEQDFEKCEVEEHVKTAFLHAVRDVEMTGRLNVGTHEYLEQYGVNPHAAYTLVRNYLASVEQRTTSGEVISVTVLYDFLDEMHDMFKEEYKHAMRRIGLQKIVSEDYLFLDDKTGEEIDDTDDDEEINEE